MSIVLLKSKMIVESMVLLFKVVDGVFDVSVNLDVEYVENDVEE